MQEEVREEIERLLDDLEAPQTEDGARQVTLPCGAVLTIMLPEDSPDLYAETEALRVPAEDDSEPRFRDLCSLNLFWRELEGFTVTLHDETLVVQTREDLARLADEEALHAWLGHADKAVRLVREVGQAPYPNSDVRDGAADEGSDSEEGASAPGVKLWP